VQTSVAGEYARVTARGVLTITVALKTFAGAGGTTQSVDWIAGL